MKYGIHIILAALVAATGTVKASPPEVKVPRLSGDVTLDGKADEALWKVAALLDGFTVSEPKPGLEPKFTANGRVFLGENALYIWVEIHIPKSRIYAALAPRDTSPEGDLIGIIIDTAATARRAYGFAVSAAGVLSDAKMNYEGELDGSWDALYDAATHIGENSWSAEVRIPFSSLRFDPKQTQWGFHVQVKSRHFQQALSWAPLSADKSKMLQEAGILTNVGGLSPGRSIELLPAVTSAWTKDNKVPLGDCAFEASWGEFEICTAQLSYGLSAKWAVTPALTLDAVMNPDFSQIEADAPQLQVNNRFALYLTEKRPFFLEGRELFRLPLEIMYTRAIGQPEFALKLTGSVANVRVATLVALDSAPPDSVADSDFSPSEFEASPKLDVLTTVARVQVDLGRRASVGAIVVDREYLDSFDSVADNQVLGLDTQVQITKQLRAEAAGFFSHATSLKNNDLLGHAAHLRLVVQEDEYRVQSRYQRISRGFRAESGYLPRRGFHNVFHKVDFYYRSENPWGRVISPGVWSEGWIGEDGKTQELKIGANNFWLFGGHIWLFSLYERRAESIDGQWLEGNFGQLQLGSKTIDELQFSAGFDAGDTVIRDESLLEGREPYLGYMLSPYFNLEYRPTPALRLKAGFVQRLLYEKYGGRKLASEPVTRCAISYHITRDLSLRYIIEYEERSHRLVNDGLLRYEPSKGTVFYLRYREQSLFESTPQLEIRSIFLKLSLLFSV